MGGRLRSALSHHAASSVASLAGLLRTPIATLLTVAVIAIAVALPAGLLVLVTNASRAASAFDLTSEITVFLQPGATGPEAAAIAAALASDPAVTATTTVSPEAALTVLAEGGEFGDALAALPQNPLPWAVVLQCRAGTPTERLEALARSAETLDGVAFSQFDMAWLIRFNALIEAGSRIVHLIAALLAIGILLIVGNTIRLAIENRREEIEIIKMLGGTDGFIRRPFLYTGAWIGALAGVLAVGVLLIASVLLREPLAALATAFDASMGFAGLAPAAAGALLVGSVAAGWLGAWVAVARHLAEIQPR
ncbi:MAG: permease-like cell division protein FtsX [Pseudomonadota bacterium]